METEQPESDFVQKLRKVRAKVEGDTSLSLISREKCNCLQCTLNKVFGFNKWRWDVNGTQYNSPYRFLTEPTEMAQACVDNSIAEALKNGY